MLVRTSISVLFFCLLAAQALFSEQEYPGEPEILIVPDSLETEQAPVYKTAWATRVSDSPLVDGYPDDSCWARALSISDFTQSRPNEGESPTEDTEVRIVYDDESIYFLFICYDREPDKIEARLTPRDLISSSDNVRIYIDSYFDRRTAFQFAVNAVNVQEDVLWSEDTRRDESWNAVWYSQVKQLDYGWVAEIEIPFSCLRFRGGLRFRTWGLNLTRYIQRRKEYVQWRMIPESEHGFFVSRFGMLGGLEGIKTPYRLEFLPYSTFQMQDNAVLQNDWTRNLGLDLKYGPTPGVTLDLAVNPEFGTVETDEEKLNLSPFPTYYPEKRPFFLEFQDIFRTDIRLVHTRRIGKPLRNVVNPTTTIMTGGRLVGKTETGLRYGLIEAITKEENYYYLDEDGDSEFDSGDEEPFRNREDIPLELRDKVTERFLEPRTNYLVGRLLKEYEDGSSLGMIGTAVNRDARHPDFDHNRCAYTGGFDWDFRVNHTWMFAGQLAGSAVEDDEGAKQEGYGLEINLRKFTGEHFTYGIGYDSYSDDFNVNDLGWIYGNDYGTHKLDSFFQYRSRPLKNGIRSYNINWRLERNWTDSGLDELMGKTFGNRYNLNFGPYTGGKLGSAHGMMSGWLQFMNYWNVHFGLWRSIDNSLDAHRAAEDYDFIFKYPRGFSYWCGFSNDYSSMLNVSVTQSIGSFRDGERWSGSIRLRLRPSTNLELMFEPRLDRHSKFSDFSEIVELEGDNAPDKVLAMRDTRFESYVFRTSYTMSNKLDFRLFAQYTDFHSDSYEPLMPGPWDIESPLDARSTLGLHFVTRFEYRPGSYFYLVYRESRYDEADGGFGRPDRQIIGKFTYWLKKG